MADDVEKRFGPDEVEAEKPSFESNKSLTFFYRTRGTVESTRKPGERFVYFCSPQVIEGYTGLIKDNGNFNLDKVSWNNLTQVSRLERSRGLEGSDSQKAMDLLANISKENGSYVFISAHGAVTKNGKELRVFTRNPDGQPVYVPINKLLTDATELAQREGHKAIFVTACSGPDVEIDTSVLSVPAIIYMDENKGSGAIVKVFSPQH